ncbi:MAG: single-stranded DNA-binding protein [Defluviitaleaceae bacterium]|nr:single-stranded DNA-binding protein [Defluviitaleaceae bacterium]
MNEEMSNNIAEVTGRVATDPEFSHEVYGEGFYSFEIEVSRLSQVSDFLPVTISERLIDSNRLVKGKLVKISGQVRSYNNFVEETRRNRLILTLFARDIEILSELGDENPNDIFLNGYICKPSVYRTTPFGREITDLLVAVNRSYNKSDYIPCIAWGRNAKFAGRLMVGDNIRLWGRMQSRGYQKKYETGDIEEKIAYEISVSKLEIQREE